VMRRKFLKRRVTFAIFGHFFSQSRRDKRWYDLTSKVRHPRSPQHGGSLRMKSQTTFASI
jgi:hypothetical protein